MDFDLGMRLGEMACEMPKNNRTGEQVEVLQREVMRWDTQVFVVYEF